MSYSRNLVTRLFAALSLAMIMAMTLSMSAGASSVTARPGSTGVGTPRFYEFHHNFTAAQLAKASLKSWTSTFKSGGKTYTYTMVGTDPSKGSATTTTKNTLIPLKVTLNGTTFDGAKKISLVTQSPEYQNAPFISGKTQYNDADIRAEFWKYVSSKSKNYHVLLAQPHVNADYVLKVPPADGGTAKDPSTGKTIGLIDINWFDPAIQGLLTKLHFTPDMLPIFILNNVYLTGGAPNINNCCIGGYHNAVSNQNGMQTYSVATIADKGVQGGFSEDVNALSHELGEWLNDPFTNNVVPNWISPLAPQYGCNNALEVGDPLVLVDIKVKGFPQYHLQDLVFFSWFARQTPSIAINGLYTFGANFKHLSKHC